MSMAYIAKGAAFAYGLSALGFCSVIAALDGSLFKRRSKEEDEALQKGMYGLLLCANTNGDSPNRFRLEQMLSFYCIRSC